MAGDLVNRLIFAGITISEDAVISTV